MADFPVYNEVAAERHWDELVALFAHTLAPPSLRGRFALIAIIPNYRARTKRLCHRGAGDYG